MADEPIDFEAYRLDAGLAAMVPRLRAELEEIQAMDVSALKPRELGKLRDRMLRIKLTLAMCDPLQAPRDRRPTFEELVSYLDQPAVRFVLAGFGRS